MGCVVGVCGQVTHACRHACTAALAGGPAVISPSLRKPVESIEQCLTSEHVCYEKGGGGGQREDTAWPSDPTPAVLRSTLPADEKVTSCVGLVTYKSHGTFTSDSRGGPWVPGGPSAFTLAQVVPDQRPHRRLAIVMSAP